LSPTFNAKIATNLAPLLCKLANIYFLPFVTKKKEKPVLDCEAKKDVAACSRPSQNRGKSERHGELEFVVANLQCKDRHFSGPFALQIGFFEPNLSIQN
jgi:hypothetical protein